MDFPPVKERFERLEEALHICRAMFRGERPTIEGKHYRVKDAINSPAPVTPGGPPIMIGGQGEKKTLRLMAQHAEMANFTSGFDEIPRKLEVLAAALRRRGPRPGHHQQDVAVLGRGRRRRWRRPMALRNEFLAARGLDWDSLDDATRAMVGARLIVGDADAVGEQVQELIGLGLDGITFNMPANGHDPEAVTRTVGVIKTAVG